MSQNAAMQQRPTAARRRVDLRAYIALIYSLLYDIVVCLSHDLLPLALLIMVKINNDVKLEIHIQIARRCVALARCVHGLEQLHITFHYYNYKRDLAT